MPNKATKRKQLQALSKKADVIKGVGEFTIPVSFKWTITGDMVHIITKDRYRGVVTTELPIATLREILSQVDNT